MEHKLSQGWMLWDVTLKFPCFVHLVNIIKDRDTGRAKGYAFVTFEHAEDAQDAIDGLHHTVSFSFLIVL